MSQFLSINHQLKGHDSKEQNNHRQHHNKQKNFIAQVVAIKNLAKLTIVIIYYNYIPSVYEKLLAAVVIKMCLQFII